MSLESSIVFPEIVSESPVQKKSYSLNFKTGEVSGKISGIEAFLQWVRKAIKTIRYNHLIYSEEYGNEVHSLIGKDYTSSYARSEISRMIKECLIYDNRILDVYDVESSISDSSVFVSFSLDSVFGTFDIDETFYLKGDEF